MNTISTMTMTFRPEAQPLHDAALRQMAGGVSFFYPLAVEGRTGSAYTDFGSLRSALGSFGGEVGAGATETGGEALLAAGATGAEVGGEIGVWGGPIAFAVGVGIGAAVGLTYAAIEGWF